MNGVSTAGALEIETSSGIEEVYAGHVVVGGGAS
jgi:hypothetical protein